MAKWLPHYYNDRLLAWECSNCGAKSTDKTAECWRCKERMNNNEQREAD